jgi:hypothetical protein
MAPPNNDSRRDAFDRIWDVIAEEGGCDARGGSEYQRVLAEWLATDCKGFIWNFITLAANRPAPPKMTQ